ncbi:MAG: hypothetical protein KKC75_04215 [Nanoarchaeota archaeon]|nr:hypothetical protein [Nanoarchaeota archaeon]MBU1005361.1 hypothetical protein [Nanoarchaeota archaeon]MBU1946083.1 hypothetical protein [Nanoarchaeota archaeon]
MPENDEILKTLGGMDFDETREGEKIPTGYPKPSAKYRLSVEGYNISIEEPYFWMLHYLRWFHSFMHIDKITDIFSAAENSAFFGSSQQRLGLQQDKVSQFLATIGKMVKELFQLVRELRILDERMGYYYDSYQEGSQSRESAEITLKGIWVDMVEQGAKNPASVYGMAREVQFTTLPDLFFSTHPLKQEDVDIVVERERGEFNRKVREVLKRKLRTFLAWKESTFEEIKNRRIFTLKYLRQHYEIIKMYMVWVKPYLKNIQRLMMDQSKMDTPDILVAFETSMIEAEILAKKPMKEKVKIGNKEITIYQSILINFNFRTRPEMSYVQEGYQKGPLHVGLVQMTMRCYSWTDEDVVLYKKMREQEDFKLLGVIDTSVKAAMEALGDELMRYLSEAGDDIKKKVENQKAKPQRPSDPFTGLYGGFKDMFTLYKGLKKSPQPKRPSKKDLYLLDKVKTEAKSSVTASMWGIYHHFKKHHGMLNW